MSNSHDVSLSKHFLRYFENPKGSLEPLLVFIIQHQFPLYFRSIAENLMTSIRHHILYLLH